MATIIITKGTADISAQTAGIADGDTLAFFDGNQTVNAGIGAASPVQALAGGLNKLLIGPGFTGNIGGASGSLLCDIDNGTTPYGMYRAGGGTMYLAAGGASSAITRFKQIGFGSLFLTGGTFTNLEVGNGATSVNASTVVTNYWQHGGTMAMLNNATAVTAAIISGGQAAIQRALTTLTVSDGTVMVWREDASLTPPAATTVNVYGGVLTWKGGNITTLNAFGDGRVDFSQIPAAITVGTLNIDAKTRAVSKLQSPNFTVTYTTQNIRADESDSLGS